MVIKPIKKWKNILASWKKYLEVNEEKNKGFTNNLTSNENNLLLCLIGTIPKVYMNPALSNILEFIKEYWNNNW